MKRFMLIGFVFLICLSFTVSAEMNDDVIKVLNDFYTASANGDVDKYLEMQDPFFLNIMEKESGINLRDFYKEAFKEVKTSNIKLNNIKVIINNNSALVYYRVSGNFESANDSGKINNDMVAFLWKYDEWKVRWTITRGLYEEKIGLTYATDAVVETVIEKIINKTVKKELMEQKFNTSIENYELKTPNQSYLLVYVFVIGLFIVLLIKLKNNNSFKIVKTNVKKPYSKSTPVFKKTLSNIGKKSSEIYSDAKPKVKQAIKNGRKKSIKVYNIVKPQVKQVIKDGTKATIKVYNSAKINSLKIYKKHSPKVRKIYDDIKYKFNTKINTKNKNKGVNNKNNKTS